MPNALDLSKIPALSICTGTGGFDVAVERWFAPVAYCEYDPYAQGALISRMRRREISYAPIWDDLRTLRGGMLPWVGAIYGGPPCQDFSLAGFGAGLEGDRGQLMFETLRIISECRPIFVVLENVPGLILRGLDQVLLGLDALGYDCRWTVVSAEEVGAPFLGERLFIVAKARGERYGHLDQPKPLTGSERPSLIRGDSQDLGALAAAAGFGCGEGGAQSGQGRTPLDEQHSRQLETLGQAHRERLERARVTRETWAAFAQHRHSSPGEWPSWLPEPAFPRGHDGLFLRNHAIRCSGNGVVSLQAEKAIERLIGIEGVE